MITSYVIVFFSKFLDKISKLVKNLMFFRFKIGVPEQSIPDVSYVQLERQNRFVSRFQTTKSVL